MSNTDINTQIVSTVKPNGVGAITAITMQTILLAVTGWVVATFAPIASPTFTGTVTFPAGTVARNLGLTAPVTCSASTCVIPVAQNQTSVSATIPQTLTLPSSAAWAAQYGGLAYAWPLTVSDGGQNAGSYAKTILPAGTDTIDGYTAGAGGVGLYANGASMTFQAISGGWKIQ